MAHDRAIPSARALGVPVIHVHADTLHDARNKAVAEVDTEWVVHLDADDELEPGFVDGIAAGSADVRAPAVRYVNEGWVNQRPPIMPWVAGHSHQCHAGCLPEGNWIVVGAAVRAELVRRVGGWRDWPMYEDWDLWLRCSLAGATIEPVPQAVYRAYARAGSRNRAPDRDVRDRTHQAIYRANLGVDA